MPRPPAWQPVRRGPRVGAVPLPAEGRKGDPPAWPLPGKASKAEVQAWAELWATPQAVAWETLGWTRTVARYCRVMVASEEPDAKAPLLAACTVLEDRLGLTPKAMRLLLWHITDDTDTQPKTQPKRTSDARRRFRAIDGGQGT
ncbi:MAG: hypothetical protein H0T78_01750 [Longispora sp.]|nr:hypothetical protein [Longispora sp. (in: high G+C Gram-positive bacteria)]